MAFVWAGGGGAEGGMDVLGIHEVFAAWWSCGWERGGLMYLYIHVFAVFLVGFEGGLR